MMKKIKNVLPWLIITCLVIGISWSLVTYSANQKQDEQALESSRIGNTIVVDEEMSKQEANAARAEYYFRLLRDPVTNEIPPNIRERELEYAKQLPQRSQGFSRKSKVNVSPNGASQYQWHSVGPQDVGGRTRALGIDQRDPNVIIAGGVSGGIWKSIDGGSTWSMKTDPGQNMSVSSLVQDPTTPDTWYYASGEFLGNSASDRGATAFYRGTGVFKSTDNGESWSRLSSTTDTDISFNSPFDYISRIVVSPTTGSVFIASNGFGVYRSTDGGSTWSSNAIVGDGKRFVDINVGPDGRLVAVVSTIGSGTGSPGVFISTDDGNSWTEVTPNSFPSSHERSVAAFAPSDPSIFYVFTNKGSGDNQGISFHKFTLNESASDTLSTGDRSGNIPNFGEPVGGIDVQGGYNMLVRVKPDDPDFVMVGGINLFRSTDGFASAPVNSADSTKQAHWIGGYSRTNNVSLYENHHPDQHILAFHPTHPDTMWSGHDGGLSLTESVIDTPVTWTDKDEGYITSQFYAVAMADDTTNTLIGGGTQDNGSPFIEVDGSFNQAGTSVDASSGDGGYAHFTDSLLFVSSQLGRVIRYDLDNTGTYNFTAFVQPSNAQNQLFIHPYVVDPNDESIMYYPDVASDGTARMWINTAVDEVTNTSGSGAPDSEGWDPVELNVAQGYQVSTLEVSRRPQDMLYYGMYNSSSQPKLFRATDASGAFNTAEISIPDAASGAYIHDIALNPVDADEALVVMSNYNITGIYHTADGGSTWTAIEGNLTGTEGDGPSIRSATIMPTGNSTIYMVGTSIGLFSTETLDGGNTTWLQESADQLGNAVTEYVTSRITDGDVAVGSHGRGLFIGDFIGEFSVPGAPSAPTDLVASVSDGTVDLTWTQPPEVDVASYTIYKGSQPRNLDSLKNVSNAKAVDQNPGSGTVYYAVSAVDNDGNESVLTRPVAGFRKERLVDSNWQLLSMPLFNAGDASLPPDINLFGFDGVYTIEKQMKPGRGHWVQHSRQDTIHFIGGAPSRRVVNIRGGWNLVGGVADTIDVGEIQDPGGILSATPVKTYANNTYVDVQQILPTGGYFIHAQGKGQIVLQVDTSSTTAAAKANQMLATHRLSPVSTEQFGRLQFIGNGITQSLFISSKSLEPEEKQYFLVPPRPPQATLDVRTGAGYRLVDENEKEIKLTTSSYPVQVQLATGVSENQTYRLTGVNDGEEIYFDLEPGKPVTIGQTFDRLLLSGISGRELPLTNELLPNYPNPFNPSTNIEYQIANKAMVSLEVYNLIGRKVQTLVNKVQDPGKYQVTFNASNFSSGTYFVRIKAGDFYRVQKMTLIK